MELLQKRIWDKRHFKLLEDGIWLRVKTPTEDAELKIKYEDLGLETVYVRKKSASIVFTGLMFLSAFTGKILLNNTNIEKTFDIVVLVVFCCFLFTILFLAWSDSRKPLLGINGGEKSLTLLRNSPDTLTVDKFVEELHQRIRNRVISLRVRPDDDELPFEHKKRMLDMLKEENIVDEKRYAQILIHITPKRARIGFNTDGNE